MVPHASVGVQTRHNGRRRLAAFTLFTGSWRQFLEQGHHLDAPFTRDKRSRNACNRLDSAVPQAPPTA